ncbi:MAG: histidinol-phosphate transaminase [Desulfobacteraceae bacterium]|nr:MAG: histidinol-phosphate transaminase [Desulfobacteraceae bacterium]
MKMKVPQNILLIKPYVPGKPIEELEREYGISGSVKLASNENPLGPSPKAVKAVEKALCRLNRYPDGSGHDLIMKLSERFRISPGKIVLGNGSDEIIGMLTNAFLVPGDEAIIPSPSFLMYEITVRAAGAKPVFVPLKSLSIDLEGMAEKISGKTRIIFLCNPNNPTGTVIPGKSFKRFIQKVPPNVIVIVDEAYIEFVRDKSCFKSMDYINSEHNVVTLRTFSKIYGLAGLRIGYGIMSEDISGILNRIRPPFNASIPAQAGAAAALDDKTFFEKTVRLVHNELDFMYRSLNNKGIKYFPTQSNFFLIDTAKNADDVFENMLKLGVIVRSMTSYGYPGYIRVSIGLHEENVRFIKALEKVIL